MPTNQIQFNYFIIFIIYIIFYDIIYFNLYFKKNQILIIFYIFIFFIIIHKFVFIFCLPSRNSVFYYLNFDINM